MKPFMLSVLLLCIASPAWSQSRVYTNADLDRPLNINRTPTAEEMQGILARQFVPASKQQTEPTATVLPFDPEWPFTYSRRLETDPWRTPSWQPYWPFYNGYWFNPYTVNPYSVHLPHASGPCHGAACGPTVTHREQGSRARSR
jgi:hypothetical protein